MSGRVPVLVSHDNRYFQDTYQGMPMPGYTELFEKMLDFPGIDIRLNCQAKEVLTIQPEAADKVLFEGGPFVGDIIFTGALDEFFDVRFGRLPYRSLHFEFEHLKQPFFQSHGVVNYTVSEDFTRITEFKYLTDQKDDPETTIMREYPMPYEARDGQIPYYAINNKENDALYEKYVSYVKGVPNFHLLGRLAEYKYYNIDAIVERALDFAKEI